MVLFKVNFNHGDVIMLAEYHQSMPYGANDADLF